MAYRAVSSRNGSDHQSAAPGRSFRVWQPFGLVYECHTSFLSLPQAKRSTYAHNPTSTVLFVSDRGEVPLGARPVPYLRFNARVGHNLRFIGLSDDDYQELGGVEYRALTALLWIVSGVSAFLLLHTKIGAYERMASIILPLY